MDLLQTEREKKLKRRNQAIFADYQQIKSENNGVAMWRIATSIAPKYKISAQMVVKIIKERI